MSSTLKTYRLLISRRYNHHTEYPSADEVRRIESKLAEDTLTAHFKFNASTPNEAGAVTRTILWCSGVTLGDLYDGKVFVQLQEKHETQPWTWTTLGSWDHFGVEYSPGL